MAISAVDSPTPAPAGMGQGCSHHRDPQKGQHPITPHKPCQHVPREGMPVASSGRHPPKPWPRHQPHTTTSHQELPRSLGEGEDPRDAMSQPHAPIPPDSNPESPSLTDEPKAEREGNLLSNPS